MNKTVIILMQLKTIQIFNELSTTTESFKKDYYSVI